MKARKSNGKTTGTRSIVKFNGMEILGMDVVSGNILPYNKGAEAIGFINGRLAYYNHGKTTRISLRAAAEICAEFVIIGQRAGLDMVVGSNAGLVKFYRMLAAAV